MYGADTREEEKKTGVRCERDVDQSKGDNKYATREGNGEGGRTCRDWIAARQRRPGTRPHRQRWSAVLQTRLRVGDAMRHLLGHTKDLNASR